jgi:hypothetical protein
MPHTKYVFSASKTLCIVSKHKARANMYAVSSCRHMIQTTRTHTVEHNHTATHCMLSNLKRTPSSYTTTHCTTAHSEEYMKNHYTLRYLLMPQPCSLSSVAKATSFDALHGASPSKAIAFCQARAMFTVKHVAVCYGFNS